MSVTTQPKRFDEGEGRKFPEEVAGNGKAQRESGGRFKSGLSKRVLLGATLPLGGALLIAAVGMLMGDLRGPDQPLVYYTATRGDLAITVTERGNLESQNNVDVICEVDDIQGDGVNGTTVLFIVPNGSSVKKGDLLVTLDKAPHQERLDRQIVDRERALAEQIQTKAKHDNQATQNETAKAEAELAVKLAKMELDMFQDKKNGTYQLEVEEINRLIEDINNQILEAQANLELKKNDVSGIESLFKLGYKGKSELERSRLECLQAEGKYAATLNKLQTQLSMLKKKESYEYAMGELKLEGAVKTAERALAQVLRDNEALLAQAKAAMEAADEAFKKEDELLTRYREQVKNCEIFAPADGMVAYAVPQHRWHAEISQGAPVSPRQHIIRLPNLKEMQVKTSVHESVLDQVKMGLPATVRVDAFPDRSYRGSVRSVAVLPDQEGWMSSDTKVYETVVTIEEEVEQLKPGMTAVVEIHIDRLRNVLSVPVQAVVQIEDESWCYVGKGRSVERRLLTLGRTNDKFVEIREGLAEGDRVVLNPMAIVDEAELRGSSESPDEEPEEEPEQPTERPEPRFYPGEMEEPRDREGGSSDQRGGPQEGESARQRGPERSGGAGPRPQRGPRPQGPGGNAAGRRNPPSR